ncbi:MAG: hypothetical protein LBT56_03335 [Prevotellaceae bacterium]|jgi:hypothetical protein|nr:hypothetical protein [Prevotellaceae bacterium]
MKKIVFILMILFSFALNAQEKTIIWDYPVKPGSEQWATFTTGQQMFEACQIPQNILNVISTKQLADICLNYPLFFEYIAFNNEREGIRLMIKNFNGLNELSKRENGVQELIKTYKDFPILSQIQDVSSIDYDTPYKLPFLELLLSDDLFLHKLSNNELVEFKKDVLNRYENKLKNMNVYSVHNIKKTILLGAIILDKVDDAISSQQHDIIKNYIENYNTADSNLLTEISKIISQL